MSAHPPEPIRREDVCEVNQPEKTPEAADQPAELWIRSLWIWFIIIGVLLALNAIYSQIVFRELNNQREVFLNNRQLQVDFMQFLSALKDIESGQRGYLLTADKSYLGPYDQGLERARKQIIAHFLSGRTIRKC
ncbi:MAG TPA: CHASE3 domain-containing protein [Chthoniobacterales bacterium]|jgi:hypothetical protein